MKQPVSSHYEDETLSMLTNPSKSRDPAPQVTRHNILTIDKLQSYRSRLDKNSTKESLERRKLSLEETASKPYGKLPESLHSIYKGSEDLFLMAQIQKQYQHLRQPSKLVFGGRSNSC